MTYEWGDWNATCSMCGRQRKAGKLVKNWQGQWRCPEHNEGRHPQEFVRAVPAEKPPLFVQRQTGVSVINDFLLAEESTTSDYIYLLTEDADPLTTET